MAVQYRWIGCELIREEVTVPCDACIGCTVIASMMSKEEAMQKHPLQKWSSSKRGMPRVVKMHRYETKGLTLVSGFVPRQQLIHEVSTTFISPVRGCSKLAEEVTYFRRDY